MANIDRLLIVFRTPDQLNAVPVSADLVQASITLFCNIADPTDLRRISLDGFSYVKLGSKAVAPVVSIMASIVAPPVVNRATRYTLPAGSPAVVNQQWYSNAGTGLGPMPILGANGATYVQTSTSEGWMSVRGTCADGSAFASAEFTTQHGVVSKGATLTPIPAAPVGSNLVSAQNAIVLSQPTMARWYVGAYYQDRLMAPGSYSAYDTNYGYGDLAAYGPSYNVNSRIIDGSGTPAVMAQVATAATAARPPANTGNGFYVANGQIYDWKGNQFRVRGANVSHWDSGATGIGPAKVNAIRVFLDFSKPWATNKALLDSYIALKIVPIILASAPICFFTGSVTAGVLQVTSVQSGRLTKSYQIRPTDSSNTWRGVISSSAAIPTGGGAGTYTLSSSSGDLPDGTTFTGYVGTTGNNDPDVVDACVQTYIDNRSNLSQYDTNAMYNLVNEWGPPGTSTNTVWRDANASGVARMRTAGFPNPIVVDAPGGGQDSGATGGVGGTFHNVNSDGKTYAQNVFEADTMRNTVFSYHVYGAIKAGGFGALAAKLYTLSQSTGMCFIVGEFGPTNIAYNGGSPTSCPPLEVMSVCEAYGIGWCAWAIDDPANMTTDTGAYALIKLAGSYTGNGGGYKTGNPAELTDFGRTVFLDPVYGTQVIAQPASIFS